MDGSGRLVEIQCSVELCRCSMMVGDESIVAAGSSRAYLYATVDDHDDDGSSRHQRVMSQCCAMVMKEGSG